MSRERVGFREQLDRLSEKFPGREAISLIEACKIVDRTDRHVLANDKSFPKKKLGGKWIVPLVPLANWLCAD